MNEIVEGSDRLGRWIVLSIVRHGAIPKLIPRDAMCFSEGEHNHRPQNLWLMICARQKVLYYYWIDFVLKTVAPGAPSIPKGKAWSTIHILV